MIDIPTWTKRWIQISQLDNTEIDQKNDEDLLKRFNKNIKKGLKEIEGFTGFFPIQQKVIPYILNGINSDINNYYSSDICISVPTGEGKTLCYVIPIANYLYNRTFPSLSVLVLVPTRELANQVKNVFTIFTKVNKGRFPIKITTLTGQQSFSNEMHQLSTIQPDVVISTPGRLCEHYNQLIISQDQQEIPEIFRNIHFIIIDEVDRLLSQPYNDWLSIVNDISKYIISQENNGELGLAKKIPIRILLSATISNSPYKLNQLDLIRPIYFITSVTGESNIPSRMYQRYIKVTNKRFKPETLLCLIYQLLLNKKQRNSLSKLVAENQKADIKGIPKVYKTYFKAVIFCSSKETTSNLTKYLQQELSKSNRNDLFFVFNSNDETNNQISFNFENIHNSKILIPFNTINHSETSQNSQDNLQTLQIEEFSSLLLQKERNLLMKKFNNNEFNILVCSDILARGIDISDVDIVINYDVPNNIKTYIHRAGRTARAGKTGYTYTMVESNQIRHFIKLVNSKYKNTHRQTMFVRIKKQTNNEN
ncbi:EIF4a-1 family RNA SFII helicase [Cryptosporidium ubiquitum]|uniref:ATP-dependent RNA helicase n=1 Tax=Cryptosporidium ubiquitum TaxID=857276 RepID=A0A1J4MHD5_9CRYT|nr:EIF4a-1 family RNA SFII helicase [Cryptosporidium ubiquitum]OII72420.1 EIF4a-1 family RNA SFII helicase [Cryptosporidium ubiquitum]